MVLFVEYPKCTTCQKAERWLQDQGLAFQKRDITSDVPTREELALWVKRSGCPVKRFFNTSGMLYRQMGLTERVKTMTEDERLALLSTNGMLINDDVIDF
ncbi:MAG: glutaredoxin domain-containing protein, partial [Clostridiaceae bacterium]|nr:glutaredoxin domain-containing protein [Clostridiaceae bacterium]